MIEEKKVQLIGIDGGASKVSGWEIKMDSQSGLFSLGELNVQKQYRDYEEFQAGFTPVDVKQQLAEMNGEIQLTEDEKKHGRAYMYAAADVIIEITKKLRAENILVGIGMPGLKAPDKRGIVALANGPRLPEYAAIIEKRLEAAGVKLSAPISHLGSDADYCGLGEEYAADGAFGTSDNAYYLGGGTGVADAMKLRGKLLPFDAAKPWIAKAWEMKSSAGLSIERYASSGGIQFLYSQASGISLDELNTEGIFPPQIMEKAIAGDEAAKKVFADVATYLGRLLFERMQTLWSGWKGNFEFVNPAKPALESAHPYHQTFLEKLIIGQRLGDLMAESIGKDILWEPVMETINAEFAKVSDAKFKNAYLCCDSFRQSQIFISKLREAPALGAGVDAWLTHKKKEA
ncbi:MAG TPA: ROK family protein [Candidatus Marinimicrobia bacterium]|nr:ROK family protein [Candidatus Neomarinimicrobiota bacterium]